MKVYRLRVLEIPGVIEAFFLNKRDAETTFRITYSKVENKPHYKVEEIDVLDRETHL